MASISRADSLIARCSSVKSKFIAVRGIPSTRSATMFLRISVVPPSIEFARARSMRYVHSSSCSWARGPAISIASSVSAWLTSDQCHLPSEPSGPGTPYFMVAVSPR